MSDIRLNTPDHAEARMEVTTGPAAHAQAGQVHIAARGSQYVALVATPAQARELAAALVRAAGEAEAQALDTYPTVSAGELRRGDVRSGERPITVDRVRVDGDTAHVTWTSDVGRHWTQSYPADSRISLRRRA
ncbi:hypothetical protein [Streptomyces hypolithicus]